MGVSGYGQLTTNCKFHSIKPFVNIKSAKTLIQKLDKKYNAQDARLCGSPCSTLANCSRDIAIGGCMNYRTHHKLTIRSVTARSELWKMSFILKGKMTKGSH